MKEENAEEDKKRLEEFTRAAELEQNTQARKKLRSYFLEISRTEWFENKIIEFRKKYGVPEGGYVADGQSIMPPEQLPDRWNAAKAIGVDVEKICEKYSLHSIDWSDDIESYLFYNKFFNVYDFNTKNLIYLADLAEEKIDPFEESTQAQDNKYFPIALRISPYATERDILDFVKKTYTTMILPALKQYRKSDVKIGRVKSKDEKIAKRNKFIYEHKHLPRKQIMRLLHDKFGIILDYGHIGKIISLEIKKRKELST